MENFTELLNNFTLEQFMPSMEEFTGWFQWLLLTAARVGPVCILLLGLAYLLIPPREANHHFGFRTYFGMGSIDAWIFTQRIAGVIMIPVGIVLTIVSFITVGNIKALDLAVMANKALALIKVQVILALVIYVFMFVLTAVFFNRNGDLRFSLPVKGSLQILLFSQTPIRDLKKEKKVKKPAAPVKADLPPLEEVPMVFEQQGQQVITAEDIVIEDI